MDFYRDPKNDCKHLAPYTDLIYDSPVVPVIVDSNGGAVASSADQRKVVRTSLG